MSRLREFPSDQEGFIVRYKVYDIGDRVIMRHWLEDEDNEGEYYLYNETGVVTWVDYDEIKIKVKWDRIDCKLNENTTIFKVLSVD